MLGRKGIYDKCEYYMCDACYNKNRECSLCHYVSKIAFVNNSLCCCVYGYTKIKTLSKKIDVYNRFRDCVDLLKICDKCKYYKQDIEEFNLITKVYDMCDGCRKLKHPPLNKKKEGCDIN